jgi:hypothetical protein
MGTSPPSKSRRAAPATIAFQMKSVALPMHGEKLMVADKLMDRSATYLKSLVGAPGFEPGASCAQGRRATRLRYAPTLDTVLILLHLYFPFLVAKQRLYLNCAK